MIKNTQNKNLYALPSARLKFSEAKAAFVINEVEKKPLIKAPKQAFPNTFKVKKTSFNRLLDSLNAEAFARLQPYLQPVSLAVGDSIYQPQDRIRDVYFPESAVISQLQMLEDGRTVEVAMTGREGVSSFASVFNAQPSLNWTEVVVAGTALKLNVRIFKQEFDGGGALHAALLNFINSYIEQISQRVICNNFHQIEERFCSWLLMLQNRSGAGKFSLTQEQIARFLGVHRPSVSLIAGELRARRIIDYRRGEITILNLRKLEQSTCSCF